MKAVRTNELQVGDWAAHMMDLPNCRGIEVFQQGEIISVEHCDVWGTPSETHTTIVIRERGASPKGWDDKMSTIHNSHMWLVRTLGK
jgi:hypothetical protein